MIAQISAGNPKRWNNFGKNHAYEAARIAHLSQSIFWRLTRRRSEDRRVGIGVPASQIAS
eukprot:SAG31_NODE_48604_length_179_cov_34.150000_1_plen_59_part_11